MRQQVATADARTLTGMRGEIAAAAASAQATAQQAKAAAGGDATSDVANAAQAARATVNDVMRGMKDFDPYLQFANAQDEAEYRRREDERRAYIAAEQRKGTPEGDLNASGAAVGQMADAAAHGAGDSPEFQQRWDRLTASTNALRSQLIRDGKDVSEFDAHLCDDLRAIMRSKGIPNAQIDAALAAHPDNPMEAMKAFVAQQKGVISENEIDELSRKAKDYKDNAAEAGSTASVVVSVPPSPLVDAMAKFKSLGVSIAHHDANSEPAHGVTANAATSTAPSRSI